ncbi:MAG: hypothetical protein U0235_07445 [Polyangiaceae bacterium]
MAVNHALLFINNGPRQGMEPRALENYEAIKAFWNHKKQAGKIDNFMFLTPQSTGNKSMPAAMLLVTGDRATLQDIRWADEEFLKLHTQTMMTMNDYACLDTYAGEGQEKHMARFVALMKK